MNHAYWLPPVGTSLWRKQAADGPLRGIKARTHYHPRPESWPADADWPADTAFTLVQAGLLRGKSVGFLPIKMRRPGQEEIERNPALARARFIIEKWVLLEYACVYLPAQQHAVVESVSKSLTGPGDPALLPASTSALPTTRPVVPFTPLNEIEKVLRRHLAAVDVPALVRQAVQNSWHKLRGRV
jgi:hypothetical protein